MPDDADTVIWFVGPVGYDEIDLSADLVAAMKIWEIFFYDHEDDERYVVSAEAMPHFREEGIRLAEQLANEIGSQFVVEFDPDERNPAPRRFRAAVAASNPTASRALSARAAQNEAFMRGGWIVDRRG